jgi:hypothetical protein
MWETISQVVTKVFKSKTLILGWVTVAAGALGFVAGHDFIQQYPNLVAVLVSVIGGLNIVVRAFTFLPLDVKSSLNK